MTEHNRNKKLGRKSYCSIKCKTKTEAVLMRPENKAKSLASKGSAVTLSESKANVMKEHLRRVRRRSKAKGVVTDLDLDYLWGLWRQQNGKCAYTNIPLVNPHYKIKQNSIIYTASLDKIDSSKGYKKGNVQFVSMAINYMKSTLSDSEAKDLIELIRNCRIE